MSGHVFSVVVSLAADWTLVQLPRDKAGTATIRDILCVGHGLDLYPCVSFVVFFRPHSLYVERAGQQSLVSSFRLRLRSPRLAMGTGYNPELGRHHV